MICPSTVQSLQHSAVKFLTIDLPRVSHFCAQPVHSAFDFNYGGMNGDQFTEFVFNTLKGKHFSSRLLFNCMWMAKLQLLLLVWKRIARLRLEMRKAQNYSEMGFPADLSWDLDFDYRCILFISFRAFGNLNMVKCVENVIVFALVFS